MDQSFVECFFSQFWENKTKLSARFCQSPKIRSASKEEKEMSHECACGLTREELHKHNLVGAGGLCSAYFADGTRRVCGEHLRDHPRNPAGHSIHFIFLLLVFTS
jgi:hypothetical protein